MTNNLLAVVFVPVPYDTAPPTPHTCGCQRCLEMTNEVTIGQVASIFVIFMGIMLIVVAGLFLWGWLFKKFDIW